MDIFLLIGSLTLLLFALWKWATPKTKNLPSIKPAPTPAPVVPPAEVFPIVTEMAVTDGDIVEPTVKKVRKPRKKATPKPAAKKPRTRKPKAS